MKNRKTEKINYTGNRSRKYICTCSMRKLKLRCYRKGSDSSAKKDSGTVYRTLDEIKDSGTINIGVFSDKNPFGLCR